MGERFCNQNLAEVISIIQKLIIEKFLQNIELFITKYHTLNFHIIIIHFIQNQGYKCTAIADYASYFTTGNVAVGVLLL